MFMYVDAKLGKFKLPFISCDATIFLLSYPKKSFPTYGTRVLVFDPKFQKLANLVIWQGTKNSYFGLLR
jgi:hypothetical protein